MPGTSRRTGPFTRIQQDPVNPDLLFAGTEFGIWFTIDGGINWIRLKAGIPTISVRDIAIQKRENDLVLATFGRGFYILDDYSPLRQITRENMDREAMLFPVKDALMYLQTDSKYGQGSTVYLAKNPDFGAIFTYYIKEAPKTKKEIRTEKEKELFKKGEPIPQPTESELREEQNEIGPYLTFTISDASGEPVRVLTKSAAKGINRTNWDLRYQSRRAVDAVEKYDPLKTNGSGVLAMPGKYQVTLAMTAGGETKSLAGPVDFNVVPLNNTTLPAADRNAMTAFHKKVAELSRVMQGTENYAEDLWARSKDILQAFNSTPGVPDPLRKQAYAMAAELDTILNVKFNRQSYRPSEEENPPAPVTLNSRLSKLTWISWSTTSEPTQGMRDAYSILEKEFPPVYDRIKVIGEKELPALEKSAEDIGAPVTPSRLPVWRR